MATASKYQLSQSTDGLPIIVSASNADTPIHTAAVSGSTSDEVWIWASNIDSSVQTLRVDWGGSATGNSFYVDIPSSAGLVPVVPGFILQNSKKVACRATKNNVVLIAGFVNRITN